MSEESEPLHQFLLARHAKVNTRMQNALRTLGVLSVIGGVIFGMAAGIQYGNDMGLLVWAQDIGEGIIWCVLLYALAAIVDALRVIAANSFKDAPGSRRADALPGADAKQ